ncbi:MAG TPA: nucleotidyltransferase domain-containing protein [Firmicutes bacterium]|nr:nucleotidyltransferase domain-containing protein [Bacillota bacterium]
MRWEGTSARPEELSAQYAGKYPLTFADDQTPFTTSLRTRYRRAWRIARKAGWLLKHKYGAQKVVVFGSLTDPSRFGSWSDIDLAAWGIPDSRFYAAVGTVTGLSNEFKVDLVDAETCRAPLRKAIDDEGAEI